MGVTPPLNLAWGCRIGDQRHDRVIVDSLGLNDAGVALYLAQCQSCEHKVMVSAVQFAALEPCCRRKRRQGQGEYAGSSR